MPQRRKMYAVPYAWYEQYGIQRYGFHGASHRYAAEKVVELAGRADLKHVNMHLGGSSSLCAVKDGVSQGASHGAESARRSAAEQPHRRLGSVCAGLGDAE